MAVLKSTNVQGALCVNGVAIGGGKDIKYCCFTASTTFTPSQNLVDGGGYVEASLVAGGGGGGGAGIGSQGTSEIRAYGGGGGGGEVRTTPYLMTSSNACTVTIGAKGAPGRVTAVTSTGDTKVDSTNGGDTTFLGETVFGGTGGTTTSYSCNRFSYQTQPAVNGPIGGLAIQGRVAECSFNKKQCCVGGYGGGSTAKMISDGSEDPYGPIQLRGWTNQSCFGNTTCACINQDTLNNIINSQLVSSSIGLTSPSGSGIGDTPAGYVNLGRSNACAATSGGGTMIINGKMVGAGGSNRCMCGNMKFGASSEFGGGGAGAFAEGTSAELVCTGYSGSAGLVVLRWEE